MVFISLVCCFRCVYVENFREMCLDLRSSFHRKSVIPFSARIFCQMMFVIIYTFDGVQDPKFWTYRPLSELMVRAAADDVRFLLYIYHKMTAKLSPRTLWYLAVRGALYCRCFCVNDNDYADWPSLPPIPGRSKLNSHAFVHLS